MKDNEKPNYFVRFLITAFIVFLIILVSFSFFLSDYKFFINSGIITVLLLITVLILSEAFDNLSLGKLMSLSREVKSKSEEVFNTKKENTELRENLLRLSATFSQLQAQSMTNNNLLFTPDTFKLLGVEKAPEKEIENEKDNEDEVVREKNDVAVPEFGNKATGTGNPRPRIDYRVVEEIALHKYAEKHNISVLELLRDVRFRSSFENIDPIMERKMIFDGYHKTREYENFIEIKRINTSTIMFDRIYVLLAKILFYRQAKKTDAFLTLILTELPENLEQSSYHSIRFKERFFELFQPAIVNDLLRIEIIEISEEEIQQTESRKETAVSSSE